VVVYSHADRNAPFVTLADESVFLGPSPSPSSYLDADKLIKIALDTRVDAIHPGTREGERSSLLVVAKIDSLFVLRTVQTTVGYGFLSENESFCKKVEAAGLIFVGPTSEAIASMGSKIGAKRLLQAKEGSSVPLIPG